jgi:2-polyprenyl-3-methyl-5-hydroxy-6-metoxy-1,4-benzoquinol methylase
MPAAPTHATAPDALDVGALARRLYVGGGTVARLIQHHRHRIAPVAELVAAVPAGSDVLDVGCGGGLLLACLACAGRLRSGLGVDSSATAIAAAEGAARRMAAEGVRPVPRFERRSVEQGLPEGRFDVVCLVDVLHHVPPAAQEQAFRDAASRVRPGGMLLYKDMCDAPAWRAGMNRLHDLVMVRHWIHYVPVERADAWAQACGLRTERAESRAMLWYGHELRTYRRPGVAG